MPRTREARLPWPLMVACLIATVNVVALLALPRSASLRYGPFAFGAGLGGLAVVFAYARLFGRQTRPQTVRLVDGPCDGSLLLSRSGPTPNELWLADEAGSVSAYVRHRGSRRMFVLRYQPLVNSRTGPPPKR